MSDIPTSQVESGVSMLVARRVKQWFGNICEHSILVNQLNSDRDIVKTISSKLRDSEQFLGFSNVFKAIAVPKSGIVRDGPSRVILKSRVWANNWETSIPCVADDMKRRTQMENGEVEVNVSQTARKFDEPSVPNVKVDCHGDDITEDLKQDVCLSLSLCDVDNNNITSVNPTINEEDVILEDDIESKESAKKKGRNENKLCWSCSADPANVVLWRCKGCKKAWYCGEQCQEEDWPVHGPWCERKRNRREERHKAKEEEERKLSPTALV